MNKKDYDTIAACIGGALSDTRNDEQTILDIARRLSTEFKLDNPRYNQDKFFDRVYFWRKSHGL